LARTSGQVSAGVSNQAKVLRPRRGVKCKKKSAFLSPNTSYNLAVLSPSLSPFRPDWTQTVYLFVASAWQGEAAESEEMRPRWFALDALPFDQMWDDGRYWLPRLIRGETLHLLITFGEDNATVRSVVGSFPAT
jgi:hypothetical protein